MEEENRPTAPSTPQETMHVDSAATPAEASPAPAAPGALDFIYGILTQPNATFRRLAENPQPWLAIFVYILNTILAAVGFAASPTELPVGVGMIAFVGIVFGLLVLVWQVGSTHLAAELLGGSGRAVTLLWATMLSSLPAIFNIPGQVLESATGAPVSVLVSIVTVVWSVWLQALAVKHVYGISGGRGLGAVLMPIAFVIGALTLVVVAIGSAIVTQFNQGFEF